MSNQIKTKQLMQFLLSSKQYSTTLKKKANIQNNSLSDYNEIGSTPSIDYRPHELSEIVSPMLTSKASSRDIQPDQPTSKAYKKQHSMSFLPDSRKFERERRKNSDILIVEPTSPTRTYNPSSNKASLTQSYRVEFSKAYDEGEKWKNKKPGVNVHFGDKLPNKSTREDKDDLSDTHMKLNKTVSLPFNTVRTHGQNVERDPTMKKPQAQNPQMVRSLIQEISSLKSQICMYKTALLALRSRYLEMEERVKDRAAHDHLLDVLKLEIGRLQDQNQRLNHTIAIQNEKIINFESSMLGVAQKLMAYFQQQSTRLRKAEAQGAIYRQIMTAELPGGLQVQIVEPSPPAKQQGSVIYDSSSDSEGDCYTSPLASSGQVLKTEQQFRSRHGAQGSQAGP